MGNCYIPLALKLYQKTLEKIFDYDWCGLNFYYYLKPHVRRGELLNSNKSNHNVLGILAKYVFREFIYPLDFDPYPGEKCIETCDIDKLKGDELIWHLEFIVGMIKHHANYATDNMASICKHLNRIDDIFGTPEAYISTRQGKRKFTSIYSKVIRDYTKSVIMANENNYCNFVVDRIFLDRQLCHYIAELIKDIGLYGGYNEPPSNWIKRCNIPKKIKSALYKRENQECAICKIPLSLSEMTLDHIIPLSKGGHNDLVNLQCVCNICNQKKSDKLASPESSISSFMSHIHYYKKKP
tara:strand:- start:727 stop:1614 length:888 start_codon:yes stop_codon:yes gene_type:complete